MKKMNCVPKFDSLLTFIIKENFFEPNVSFCSLNDKNQTQMLNDFLSNYCNNECPDPCDEQYFFIELVDDSELPSDQIDLNFYEKFNIKVIYVPKMLLTQYFIAIVNSMSLWHGINFRYLTNKFIQFFERLIRKWFLRLGRNFKKIFSKVLKKVSELYLIIIINLWIDKNFGYLFIQIKYLLTRMKLYSQKIFKLKFIENKIQVLTKV
jgi:hypothetical protein